MNRVTMDRITIFTGRKIISVPASYDDNGTTIVTVSTNEAGRPLDRISVPAKTARLARNGSHNALRAIARQAAPVLGLKGTARYVNGHLVQLVRTDRKTGTETVVGTIAIRVDRY